MTAGQRKFAGLTPTEQAQLLTAFSDHETFVRECISIRDLGGTQVPFELFPGPRKVHAAISRQRRAGKPVRIVILKTRRSFFTAGIMAEIFHEVPFFPGRRATIIANNYKPAGLEAFDYIVQYTSSYRPFTRFGVPIELPRVLKPQRPMSPVSAGAQLEMLFANGSSIDVLSAEGGDVGRGGGRHWLLCDEVAFWRDAGVTLTAILQMIPKLPETGVVIQSTANGIGGEFYDLVQRAKDPSNESGWEFVFFGWTEHPLYRMPVDNRAAFQASLTREERTLADVYGVSLEQLAWRRLTIATECRGSVDKFKQEYPTTAEEAFLSSGNPVFSESDLIRHPVCEGASGELELIEEPPAKRLVWIPKDHGSLVVWRKPEPGHQYVIGADPSKGKDVSSEQRGTNPDFSVGFVVDRWTGEQVAQLRARIRPLLFAKYLVLLARWYQWAYLVPEANDAGFIDQIVETHYPMQLIYSRQRDPTDRRPARIEEIGFETTPLTREWLVTAAEEAIRSMAITIRSPIALSECRTFVIKPNGKKEHQADTHDDCVFALALAAIGLRFAPRKEFRQEPSTHAARVTRIGSRRGRDEDDDE